MSRCSCGSEEMRKFGQTISYIRIPINALQYCENKCCAVLSYRIAATCFAAEMATLTLFFRGQATSSRHDVRPD